MNELFHTRLRCPACEGTDYRIFYKAPLDRGPINEYLTRRYSGRVDADLLSGADYRLAECADCRCIFQQKIPGQHVSRLLYERWITPDSSKLRRQDVVYGSYVAQEIMQLVYFLGNRPSRVKTLDFGMGWGRWAIFAKGMGCESCGYEFSEPNADFGASNGISMLPYEDIPGNDFDIINLDQVLEHLPEPKQTLQHLKRGLKPGGLLKISVPSVANIDKRLAAIDWTAPYDGPRSMMPLAPLEHLNYFRSHTFRVLSKQLGLRRVFIPIRVQYGFLTGWTSVRQIAKNVILPWYRNLYQTPKYVLLRQPEGAR